MKTDTDNPQNAAKLARYLSGEMSKAEMQLFELEISASEEDITSMEEMKKQWSALGKYKEPEPTDVHEAWNKLHSRLRNDNLVPAGQVSANSRLLPRLVKAAALLLLLLGIGAVIYFTSRHTNPNMLSINTGNESNTLIKTLADGSVIYIAENSLFSFPERFEAGTRNVELKGEAFFDIASNPQKPFIIETSEAFIEVLGTAFNVKTENGTGFELIVDRGKVKVTLKSDPSGSQFVVAGEKITNVKNSLVKTKHSVSQATAWYKERMQFKDEPLQNIISVLNRNFNTTFVVAENEVGNRRLTVTFHNETAETMTELLCLTLNLKSQTINGSVILSEKKESAKQN